MLIKLSPALNQTWSCLSEVSQMDSLGIKSVAKIENTTQHCVQVALLQLDTLVENLQTRMSMNYSPHERSEVVGHNAAAGLVLDDMEKIRLRVAKTNSRGPPGCKYLCWNRLVIHQTPDSSQLAQNYFTHVLAEAKLVLQKRLKIRGLPNPTIQRAVQLTNDCPILITEHSWRSLLLRPVPKLSYLSILVQDANNRRRCSCSMPMRPFIHQQRGNRSPSCRSANLRCWGHPPHPRLSTSRGCKGLQIQLKSTFGVSFHSLPK
mmetsp:Transcript_11203/g.24733  ORF Transcript_11203/g.24733 Transcript_11203/m.24733 type:complete len:262 (-) Transcript_11203:144-929(-)